MPTAGPSSTHHGFAAAALVLAAAVCMLCAHPACAAPGGDAGAGLEKPPEFEQWEMPDEFKRIAVCLSLGSFLVENRLAGYSGSSLETRNIYYDDVFGRFGERPWFAEIDACYYFMPALGLDLRISGFYTGGKKADFDPEYLFGTDIDLSSFDSYFCVSVLSCIRICMPFNVDPAEWFMSSKVSQGSGFAPYLQLGAGAVYHSNLLIHCNEGPQHISTHETMYRSSIGFSFTVTAGLEYRFGMLMVYVDGGYSYFGKPKAHWPAGSRCDIINGLHASVGAGFCFN